VSTLRTVHEVGTSITVLDGDVELLRYTYVPDSPQLESPKEFNDRLLAFLRSYDKA